MQSLTAIQILKRAYPALSAQQAQLLLWTPVFFGIGIIIYFTLKFEPNLFILPVGLGVLGLAALYRQSYFFYFLLFAALMLCGFGAAQWRTERVFTPMLNKEIGPVQIEGRVIAIEPKEQAKGSRIILEDVNIENLSAKDTPRRVRLLLRGNEDIRAGDVVRGLAKLNPPSGPVAPGAFDFQRHAFFQSLGAVGFFFRAPEIVTRAPRSFEHLFENIRSSITKDTRDHVARPYDAVVAALLTGQRQGIREEDKQAMRESGLAHLLAISGLHVGMVAGAVFFFLRLCLAAIPYVALRYPIKKWAAMAALVAAAYYTFVVGAAIPAQRALMMTGLVLIAIMVDRSPFSLRLVAVAALVILTIAPEALMGVSFQMSFAAVVCLIAFYDWARPWWSSMYSRAGLGRRAFMYFLGVSTTTVIAGFATGLFALYHFQQFAVFSVLSNLIAVPIVGFIVMPAAVAYYLFAGFGLEFFALKVMEWGVSWVLATAHWTAGLEGAVLRVASWPSLTFVLMVGGALFSILWTGKTRWLGLAVFIIGMCVIPFHKQPDILIGEEAKLLAIRASDTGDLHLSSGRAARFTAENWMRLHGQEGQKPNIWPREGVSKTLPGLSCDPQGCRYEHSEIRIAFPKALAIAAAECNWADLVIADFPLKCQAATSYDLLNSREQGTAALYFHKNRYHIVTDRNIRGNRPWTSYRYD